MKDSDTRLIRAKIVDLLHEQDVHVAVDLVDSLLRLVEQETDKRLELVEGRVSFSRPGINEAAESNASEQELRDMQNFDEGLLTAIKIISQSRQEKNTLTKAHLKARKGSYE